MMDRARARPAPPAAAVSDQPARPLTIDADRRGRGVRIALALTGLPFLAALAGLGLRSPLAGLAWLDEVPLALVAAASGAVLLLVVAGAWAVDGWTVRKQLRALAAVNRQIAETRNEIETEQDRHAMESKVEATAIEKRGAPHRPPDTALAPRPAAIETVAHAPQPPEQAS